MESRKEMISRLSAINHEENGSPQPKSLPEHEININLKVRRKVNLDFYSSEKVKSLKAKLCKEYKLKGKFQDLLYKSESLNNNCHLAHCRIENGSTLDLVCGDMDEITIKVQMPCGQSELVIKARVHYTIGNIKSMIQSTSGVRFDQLITLVYNGQLLEDDNSTLASLGIDQCHATFNLITHPESLLSIYVETVDGRITTLSARTFFTAKDVKRIVGTMIDDSLIDQQLSYNGKWLRDDETLASCFVRDKSTLHMLRTFKIFVKSITGKIEDFIVDPNETVEDLKKQMFHKDGLMDNDGDNIRLIYNGRQLEDQNKMSSYGIMPDCEITKVFRLRGC